MRRVETSAVSYTDGLGVVGSGKFAEGGIVRGEERQVARPPAPSIAVAPTQSTERNRFIVEKCAELGVVRLDWLASRHGQGRPPRGEKSKAWAVSALQQSRGAHLMDIGESECGLGGLDGVVVVADPAGIDSLELDPAWPVTIVIGPEGGFAPDELPSHLPKWKLNERVLRTETATVVAAALACDMLQRSQRWRRSASASDGG